VTRKGRQSPSARTGHSWLAALAALCVFGLLATTPVILKTLHVHLHPVAASSARGIGLLQPPLNPRPVQVPPVARAIDPAQPAAVPPTADPAKEAAMVTTEDNRIRKLFHTAGHILQPQVVPIKGSLPTLVLTARPSAYTAADLAQYGALVMLAHHTGLLIYNVYVGNRARLDLGSSRLRVLYMDSSSSGFASIVAWGGQLTFQGTASQPLTIVGWDRAAKAPAADQGNGRSYIRDIGGTMTFTDVRASALGFWSGRTGGVAWTGLRRQPSTGGATSSTFTNDTYGAFVARGKRVTLAGDLFEFNQIDGVHIHRYSARSSVISSSMVRNGANGLMVDRATQATLVQGDVSQNNQRNGYFVDGRPLVTGASASGSSVAPGSGSTIENSAAAHNGRAGILVEGGIGTVIRADQICAAVTGIGIRYGASNSVVTGNDISCSPRSGLSLGPAAVSTTVSGNAIQGARIGMLVRNAGQLQIDNNLIVGARIFGISVRGLTSHVRGVGNTIAGSGFRPVDARAEAIPPNLYGTDISAWAHRGKLTFFSYLRFHPLAALWLSIVLLVAVGFLWSRRRRLPPHPYPASTRWQMPVPSVRPLPMHDVRHPEPAVASMAAAPAPAAMGPATVSTSAAPEQDQFLSRPPWADEPSPPAPPWELVPAGASAPAPRSTGAYRPDQAGTANGQLAEEPMDTTRPLPGMA
jgi:hypothetical protein